MLGIHCFSETLSAGFAWSPGKVATFNIDEHNLLLVATDRRAPFWTVIPADSAANTKGAVLSSISGFLFDMLPAITPPICDTAITDQMPERVVRHNPLTLAGARCWVRSYRFFPSIASEISRRFGLKELVKTPASICGRNCRPLKQCDRLHRVRSYACTTPRPVHDEIINEAGR